MSSSAFPPYELVDPAIIAGAADKTRKLERLYHLTHQHAWDGKAVLGALIDKYGPPGKDMPEETRQALSRVLTLLMWGELAAWNISADLALEIMDTDAKMAATAQVFDEARHFYVMRDYVMALGPVPPIGGLPRRLLRKVIDAPTLATKLVGMQLLFETNAVVIFRRLADSGVCPILTELLPYFERDESRHVGLGVMYIPRLVAKMKKAEARRTARFQFECIMLLMAGGFVIREDFGVLGMDQRQMAERVTRMQDDVVRQMTEHHGKSVMRAVLTPRTKVGATLIDLIHPTGGLETAPAWHQSLHRGVTRTLKRLDRALA
jgi:hypothetical protein